MNTQVRIGSIEDPQLCKAILEILSEEGSGILRYQRREENSRMVLDVFTEDPYGIFEKFPPNPNQTAISA